MCVPRVAGAFFSGGLSSSESNLLAGGGPGATVSSVSLLTCILPPEDGELCLAGEDTGDDLQKKELVLGRLRKRKKENGKGRKAN